MAKLLWHTMMSLDGFIAGPDDDMDWMSDIDGGEGRTIDEVLRSVGALLVGRRTQDVEDRDQPGFYGGAFRGPFFVLRHDPPAELPVVKGVTGQFLDVEIPQQMQRLLADEAEEGPHAAVPAPGRVSRRKTSSRVSAPTLRRTSAGVPIAAIAPFTMIEIRRQYSASSR